MAGHLVMVVIRTGIMPLRVLDVSTRTGPLGRRFSCHCLSVPTLIVRLIAASISPVVT
jgi:membrane protein YdbS with pleckstrin-like domain